MSRDLNNDVPAARIKFRYTVAPRDEISILDKPTATALNRRLLQNVRNKTTDLAARDMRVAAEVYCSSERFVKERERLFREIPQPVAFSAEVADPGSYLALEILSVPVVLTRTEAGELKAFLNSCSHRGARVASGTGSVRRLVCSFHGWTYSLDGACQGRPEDGAFSTLREHCALQALPVVELAGIVVLGLDPALPQNELKQSLGELQQEISGFSLSNYLVLERRRFTVKANWKLVNDLSLESYHFNSLHRDSVATVLAPNAIVDTFGRHSRWAFPLKSIHRLEALTEDQWPENIEGSCTYTLYPGVMIIVNSSGAQMIRAEPGSTVNESRVNFVGICRPETGLEEARQAYQFGGEVFAKEDLPVAEQCQQGLEASRRELLLGANEPLLQFWHRLWDDAIQ